MIAVIAAGGNGTRMLPATRVLNKHLLPTGNGDLIIDYPLRQVARLGFNEVTVVTGCAHAGQITDYIQDGAAYGFSRVHYAFQPTPAGIADVLIRVGHRIDEEGVLLILGDNYFSDSQKIAVESLDEARAWEYDLKDVASASAFGQAIRDSNGNVLDIVEKPKDPTHSKILTGMYFFPEDVLKRVIDLSPSKRNELEITDLLKTYMNDGELYVDQVVGDWCDLGEWSSWSKFVAKKIITDENKVVPFFGGLK